MLKVGMRGLFVEGPGYTPQPCVVTRVLDPQQYPNTVNIVATLDGNYVANEGWSNEEITALHAWRTGIHVLQPGEPRSGSFVYDLS